jgi:hypothetical protein
MQALDALEQANHVRLARAALKRSIKAGELNAAEVVRSSPWEVETMTVSELLRSQRRWGRTRTQKFLTLLAVGENRQVGRLTDRQRELLASHLEEKARFAH